jgi:hypothetical protein
LEARIPSNCATLDSLLIVTLAKKTPRRNPSLKLYLHPDVVLNDREFTKLC